MKTIDQIIIDLKASILDLENLKNKKPVDILDGDPPAWPKFSYLKGEISGNLTKTRTMALDDKGIIHSLGYKSGIYLKTDTSTDCIEKVSGGEFGFVGNVEASDGNTYFLPAYSTSIGKLNRATGAITTEKKFKFSPQVRSGAEGLDGLIYMPSYTTTLRIYVYNTKTGEAHSFVPEKSKRSGYMERFGHVWGAARNDKGEIYMPPALDSSVKKINQKGEFEYLDGPPASSGMTGFGVRYVGATFVKSVNKIFCLPRMGEKVLIIDMKDDSYQEIDLPEDYLKVSSKNKNFHGFEAPDGWLYSSFWGDTKCFRINPKTYQIQWRDYAEDFKDGKSSIKEGSGIDSIGTGFSTQSIVKDKSVYLGLAGTSRAIKLEFE